MGSPEVGVVEFQHVIADLSQAVADKTGLGLSVDQAVALFQGFVQMSETIQNSVDVIEHYESQMSKKKRLWRPE